MEQTIVQSHTELPALIRSTEDGQKIHVATEVLKELGERERLPAWARQSSLKSSRRRTDE